MLRLWNTPAKKVEEIRPIHKGRIGFYACGPTVYQRSHIGNFRSYIMEDILRRTLEWHGLDARHVMNITDVGHLVGDVDEGEDKMEKAAKETGRSAWDISKEYTKIFLSDLKKLNILKPASLPKATDHIAEQIALIQELEKKGFTYTIHDGVYFDTSKFSEYGKFSGQPLEEKEEGARVVANPEKRHATDFALWKLSDPGQKRHMEWKSPWGVGFPGWHVECSAMARKELGQPFDIHAGGVDHIPVHHENEIVQSEAAYGEKLANYWFHIDFLLVDGRKMSKSLKNDYSLDDILTKKIDPLAFRYFILGAHYRQKQNFTWEALQAAQNALHKLRSIVRTWDAPSKKPDPELEKEFFEAMDDDLNTPRALAAVWKLADTDVATSKKSATLLNLDKILGLGLDTSIGKPVKVPKDIQKIAASRETARANKDWKESDRLRDELAGKGWIIEDTPEGQKIRSEE